MVPMDFHDIIMDLRSIIISKKSQLTPATFLETEWTHPRESKDTVELGAVLGE